MILAEMGLRLAPQFGIGIMKPARIVVLAIAVAAAGGSALIARSMIGPADQPSVAEAPKLDTTDVLIARSEITLGQVVKPEDLKWQAWPNDSAQGSFITRQKRPDATKQLAGAIARVSLLAGEPISESKLVVSDKSGFMSAILPKGMRALSIKISPESGAGGFILPNDRVDVILTRRRTENRDGGGGESFLSETVLTNITVRAIDQTFAEKDGKQVVVGKTATMELTPEQTEIVSLAEAQGKLTLALRSLRDSDRNNTDQLNETRKTRRRGTVTMLQYGHKTDISQGR